MNLPRERLTGRSTTRTEKSGPVILSVPFAMVWGPKQLFAGPALISSGSNELVIYPLYSMNFSISNAIPESNYTLI